jgi:hypothetical protein
LFWLAREEEMVVVAVGGLIMLEVDEEANFE